MSADMVILDFDEIRTLLPHRHPCMMVDRVKLTDGGSKAVGIKNVTINEPFFQGHFPKNPVMPGILILEAMVQTGGIAVRQAEGTQADIPFLKSINRAKFRKPVLPGDRLIVNTELMSLRNGIAKLKARATVRESLSCQAEFSISIKDNASEMAEQAEFDPSLMIDGVPCVEQPMLDIHGILNILPHRYPFILVDSILRLNKPRIFGLKNVTGNEPFFQGYSPKLAVMPETMLIEAIAQVGGVYVLDKPENKDKLGYLMAVDHAQFLHPVRPGDQLVIEVETVSMRQSGGRARGRIRVGDRMATESMLTFIIVDKQQ